MKKLLIAHDLKPFMMTVMNFLQRSEIAVLTAATNDEILKLHLEQNAHLVVTRLDMPGLACETLVHTIRRAENMRAVSIMVLCEDTAPHRERSSRCGVNAVLSLNTDPAIIAGKVQEFLDVAPRRHYRVVLNMAVDGRHNNRPFMCSSENVSANGMLIRTTEKLAVGDHISCSFYLPDGKRLSASGDIVRIIDPAPASDMNRYGIRFASLSSEAEAAIAAFVEKERQHRFLNDTASAAAVA